MIPYQAKGDKMGALRFVAIFIGIMVKGCMESPAIRTILILLASIAAIIFIPYWIGLLVAGTIFPPPAWPGGLICIIVVAIIVTIVVGVYRLIYEGVKNRMRR